MLSDTRTALSGFVRANNGLQLVEDRNFIVRQRTDQAEQEGTKVKLISGGGSGHGPAFRGYVGKGMLDGAICGDDVFSPPAAAKIVDCLRVVAPNPNESVLLIVNNYPEYRVNFGLAMERARLQYGYGQLRMLLNDDDISVNPLEVKRSVGKRGIAGCAVLIKILGAMAEEGRSLDELYRYGRELLQEGCISTVAFTFDVYGENLTHIRFGLLYLGDGSSFDSLLRWFALKRFAEKIKRHDRIVVFVNNLGGTAELIMNRLLEATYNLFSSVFTIQRVYVGRFFTEMNQSGASITMLKLRKSDTGRLLGYLDHDVQVASSVFGGLSSFNLAPSIVLNFSQLENDLPGTVDFDYNLRFSESGLRMFRSILVRISSALNQDRDTINLYGADSRLGDAGSMISDGAQALYDELGPLMRFSHPARMFHEIGLILESNMGAHFGPIYGLLCQGASQAFVEADDAPEITSAHWLNALARGNAAIARYTHNNAGDRTMLRVLVRAEQDLQQQFWNLQEAPAVGIARRFSYVCRHEAELTQLLAEERAEIENNPEARRRFTHPEPGSFAVSVWAEALLASLLEQNQ